jgi:hypothetical protein
MKAFRVLRPYHFRSATPEGTITIEGSPIFSSTLTDLEILKISPTPYDQLSLGLSVGVQNVAADHRLTGWFPAFHPRDGPPPRDEGSETTHAIRQMHMSVCVCVCFCLKRLSSYSKNCAILEVLATFVMRSATKQGGRSSSRITVESGFRTGFMSGFVPCWTLLGYFRTLVILR